MKPAKQKRLVRGLLIVVALAVVAIVAAALLVDGGGNDDPSVAEGPVVLAADGLTPVSGGEVPDGTAAAHWVGPDFFGYGWADSMPQELEVAAPFRTPESTYFPLMIPLRPCINMHQVQGVPPTGEIEAFTIDETADEVVVTVHGSATGEFDTGNCEVDWGEVRLREPLGERQVLVGLGDAIPPEQVDFMSDADFVEALGYVEDDSDVVQYAGDWGMAMTKFPRYTCENLVTAEFFSSLGDTDEERFDECVSQMETMPFERGMQGGATAVGDKDALFGLIDVETRQEVGLHLVWQDDVGWLLDGVEFVNP